MPSGVRSSLIAFALLTGFAIPAVSEPATTWTDPPARKPDAAKTSPQPTVATPAAVSPPRREVKRMARVTRPSHRAVAQRRVRVAHQRPRRAPATTAYRSQVFAMGPARPVVVRRYTYPVYSDAGFPPSYEDARLDRLSTAVSSGYLVMRGRTIEYPDGRLIRVYRPADGEAE